MKKETCRWMFRIFYVLGILVIGLVLANQALLYKVDAHKQQTRNMANTVAPLIQDITERACAGVPIRNGWQPGAELVYKRIANGTDTATYCASGFKNEYYARCEEWAWFNPLPHDWNDWGSMPAALHIHMLKDVDLATFSCGAEERVEIPDADPWIQLAEVGDTYIQRHLNDKKGTMENEIVSPDSMRIIARTSHRRKK